MTLLFILTNVMTMDVMTLLSMTKKLRPYRMRAPFSSRRMKSATT